MKKKIGIAIAAIVIVAGIVFGINLLLNQPDQKGAKAITIVVVDKTKGNKKELFQETIHTDAVSLDKLLKETKDLNVKMSPSDYGMVIDSLMKKDQDMMKGPWWVFSSKNNKVCLDQSMCPAVDQVKIADKDKFTFEYIDEFK